MTEWKGTFARNLWHVRIDPDSVNGLEKVGAVDTLQLRGVDTRRFVTQIGDVSNALMEEIAAAIAAVVEYSS